VALLGERLRRVGANPDACARVQTATALAALLDAIDGAAQDGVVGALARAAIATSEQTMGAQFRKAAPLLQCLEQNERWELFDGVARLTGERSAAGQALVARVREALEHDELATALAPVVEAAGRDAVRLLTATPPPPPPPPVGIRVVEQSEREGLSGAEASRLLGELRDKVAASRTRRLSLQWRITEQEEPGS
jgi:hypothetical protein